jgi:hypothetical protein
VVQDSVRVTPHYSAAASAFLKKFYNNVLGISAYGKADTVKMGVSIHLGAIPDSLVVWVRTDNKDSAGVDLKITAADDSVLFDDIIVATANDTWQRLAFPIDPDADFVTPQDVAVECRYRVRSGKWIELTGVEFK